MFAGTKTIDVSEPIFMGADVSVIICVRNAGKYIENCLRSLLNQTFSDFEVLIIEDGRDAQTREVIQKLADHRIRHFKNELNLGIAGSRNRGIRLCHGKYMFFTDGDYILSREWIEEGLKFLNSQSYAGVEGKTYYVSEDYEMTFSDHVCESRLPGNFMTGNVAYKSDVIKSVGGFDQRYSYFEDRDIALRILRRNKIAFNQRMVAFAQQQTLTYKDLLRRKGIASNRVYLFKRFGEKVLMFWRIVYPLNLAKMIFPPVAFSSLFFSKFKSSADFALLPFTYVHAVLERLELWKTCAQERVFLV